MSSFDITKVKKMKRLTPEEYELPKVTLEGIKRMCNYLDEENPVTYQIFLENRPDLSADEVAYYKDIINTLTENQHIKNEMIQRRGLVTYEEYVARLEPPQIIFK